MFFYNYNNYNNKLAINAALSLEVVLPAFHSWFWSRGRLRRPIMHYNILAKSDTIRGWVIAIKPFQCGRSPPSWLWSEMSFDHVGASGTKFSTYTQTLVQLCRRNEMRNGVQWPLIFVLVSTCVSLNDGTYRYTSSTPCPEKRCHFIFACNSAKC